MNLFEEYEQQRNIIVGTDYTVLSIGSELPDKSVVVDKTDKELLIAAPKSTEKWLSWYNKEQVLGGLVGPWFIPTVEQLQTAHRNLYALACDWRIIYKYFPYNYYWASEEFSSNHACFVAFADERQSAGIKGTRWRVRAFRRVEL